MVCWEELMQLYREQNLWAISSIARSMLDLIFSLALTNGPFPSGWLAESPLTLGD